MGIILPEEPQCQAPWWAYAIQAVLAVLVLHFAGVINIPMSQETLNIIYYAAFSVTASFLYGLYIGRVWRKRLTKLELELDDVRSNYSEASVRACNYSSHLQRELEVRRDLESKLDKVLIDHPDCYHARRFNNEPDTGPIMSGNLPPGAF